MSETHSINLCAGMYKLQGEAERNFLCYENV